MSHRSRKRKPADGKLRTDGKPKFAHSKREYITSEDGWTHVTDRKWKSRQGRDQSRVIVNNLIAEMTLEEMVKEHDRYRQQWVSSDACAKLKKILSDTGANGKYEVRDVVCLGLGSLQALPIDWRRSSHTQLAALKIIMETLNINCRVIMQDPRSTDMDRLLLESMDCEVVDHPEAFQRLSKNSLLYAIHCPFRLLWNVKEKADPALIISNDLRESRMEEIQFTALDFPSSPNNGSQHTDEDEKKSHLERYERTLSLIEGCEELQFPQLRNDFSSTMIYWRRLTTIKTPEEASTIQKQ